MEPMRSEMRLLRSTKSRSQIHHQTANGNSYQDRISEYRSEIPVYRSSKLLPGLESSWMPIRACFAISQSRQSKPMVRLLLLSPAVCRLSFWPVKGRSKWNLEEANIRNASHVQDESFEAHHVFPVAQVIRSSDDGSSRCRCVQILVQGLTKSFNHTLLSSARRSGAARRQITSLCTHMVRSFHSFS